jgi:hypothetical protein
MTAERDHRRAPTFGRKTRVRGTNRLREDNTMPPGFTGAAGGKWYHLGREWTGPRNRVGCTT